MTLKKQKATKKAAPKKPATVLVLRTCAYDGRSYNDFMWPLTVGAVVSAPDWQPTQECGRGLHGALWGEGDGSLFSWEPDAQWLVVEVTAASVIDLRGKVKFPSCIIRHIGDKTSATAFLAERLPKRSQPFTLIGGTATAGFGGTATAGYRGTATAGYGGTATAGYGGTATAGDGGTATAGDRGTATAGDGGTATAGDGGTATAGDGGTISVRWWDGNRYRFALGYVGENGIEPNVKYRVADGQIVKADA